MTTSVTPTSCPSCHVALVAEEFEQPWCERCEWNLDAFRQPDYEPWPTRTVLRLEKAWGYRLDRSLIGRLAAEKDSRPRAGLGEWTLRIVSAALTAFLLALIAAGVWLIVAFHHFPAVVGAVVLFGIAYFFRPRLGRLRDLVAGKYRLEESPQPAFFALLREVSSATGTAIPEMVVVDFSFNAMTAVVGLKRHRLLVIGLPLWITLRPQERVALLAHEFGHLAHADSRRSLLVQPALITFGSIAEIFHPRRVISGIIFVLAPLSWTFWIIHAGLNLVDARNGRRAELVADRLAVKVAGSAGTRSLLDIMAAMTVFMPFFNASAKTGEAAKTWQASVEFARQHIADRVPRLRQLSKRTSASLFASHPAPGYRHGFVAQLPQADPAILLTEARCAQIDSELSPYAEVLLRQLKTIQQDWNL